MAKYGFNVTIGADTKPFTTALKNLNAPIRDAQNSIKRINEGLKLQPTSTAMLTSKFEQLGFKVSDTTDKLNDLKAARDNLVRTANGNYTEEQYRTLQKLNGEIGVTEAELKQAKKEYLNFGSVGVQQAIAIGGKLQIVGDKITEIGKKLSVISGAAASLLGAGLKYDAEIERSTKAFETFLGSADEAKDVVAAIRKQGEISPFDTSELIKANQMLVTTGIDATTARKTINGLADAIALTGGGNDELTRMAANLQQIQNAGKATAIDIRQFAYAGIDVYGILAKATGKTTEEIKGSAITFEQLSQALILASEEGGKYYRGQEAMSETLSGSLVKLKKTFLDLLGQVSEFLIPIIKDITAKLQGLVEWFRNLDDGQKAMIGKILAIVAVAGPLLIIIGSIISFIGGLIVKLALLKVAIGIIGGILGVALGPILLIAAGIAALIAALVLLYKKCEWFRNGVNAIVNAIKDFVLNFFNMLKTFFLETIPSWIDTIKNILSNLPYYIGYLIGLLLAQIVNFGIRVWNWVTTEVPRIITGIVNFWLELPGKIANAIKGAVSKLIEWASNMKSTAEREVPSIVDRIREFFNQLPDKLKEIGMEAIQGLFNGIKEKYEHLKSTISSVANGIKDGFTRALDIHSPSRVMRDLVGKNIVLGIEEGFMQNMPRSLSNMQTSLLGGVSGFEFGGAGNTITIYTQELDTQKLEQIVRYVDRRFGAAI